MESGARNIAAYRMGRSRLRWRAVRTTLARTCWVSAPLRVRLPPQTLRVTTAGRMACSARQLVASTDGSHRKVKMAPSYSKVHCAAVAGFSVEAAHPNRAAIGADTPRSARLLPSARF